MPPNIEEQKDFTNSIEQLEHKDNIGSQKPGNFFFFQINFSPYFMNYFFIVSLFLISLFLTLFLYFVTNS